MVFIKSPFHLGLKYEHLNDGDSNELKKLIASQLGQVEFSLYLNGHKLENEEKIENDSTVYVLLPLPGGKGGFGSMLRAIGAQIEKTTNREACRDLSGRRLRDINEEQRLKRWIAKEAEREKEKARRRKEKLERLISQPKHNFFDFEYEKELSELPERIDDALNEGLQKSTIVSKEKRKIAPAGKSSKKLKVWLGDDVSSDSDVSDADQQHSEDSSFDGSHQGSDKMAHDLEKPCCSSSADNSQSSSDLPTINSEQKNNKNSAIIYNIPSCSSNEDSTDKQNANIEENINRDMNKSAKLSEENKIQITHNDEYATSLSETKNGKSFLLEILPEPKNIDKESIIKDLVDENQGQKSESLCAKKDDSQVISNKSESSVESELEVESDIDLLAFNSPSELQELGLDKLKFALMARGLKCGGNITDRAQRLWKIRGLQPHEFPQKLLAKGKK